MSAYAFYEANDYDEAVLNANFGLGETVVAGMATPDSYRVDRVRTVHGVGYALEPGSHQ